MAEWSAFARGASLKVLMDEVMVVAESLNDVMQQFKDEGLVPNDLPRLKVYRWRPNQFDAPGIFHAISASPFEQEDQLRWKDTINVLVRLGVPFGTDSGEMYFLEPYSDLYRHQVDSLLTGPADASRRPFNGAAVWAKRTEMRSVTEEFNGIPYACIEFVIQAELDRFINPLA